MLTDFCIYRATSKSLVFISLFKTIHFILCTIFTHNLFKIIIMGPLKLVPEFGGSTSWCISHGLRHRGVLLVPSAVILWGLGTSLKHLFPQKEIDCVFSLVVVWGEVVVVLFKWCCSNRFRYRGMAAYIYENRLEVRICTTLSFYNKLLKN